MREYIRERVLYFMELKNLSWYRLSQLTGVSQQALNKLKNLQSTPEIETIDKICNGLGITMAQFFATGEERPDLTEDEKAILDTFRDMNPEQKVMVKKFFDSMKTD